MRGQDQGPGGEIGRRRGLKIPRRKACRFDSGPGHQHFAASRAALETRASTSLRGFFVAPSLRTSRNTRAPRRPSVSGQYPASRRVAGPARGRCDRRRRRRIHRGTGERRRPGSDGCAVRSGRARIRTHRRGRQQRGRHEARRVRRRGFRPDRRDQPERHVQRQPRGGETGVRRRPQRAGPAGAPQPRSQNPRIASATTAGASRCGKCPTPSSTCRA